MLCICFATIQNASKCCLRPYVNRSQSRLQNLSSIQVVARFLAQELEYTVPIPRTHTLVGSLTPAPAQPSLPDTIAPFFEAAVSEGVPIIYVAFGSMAHLGRMILPEDYLVMSRAFARLAPVKVCVRFRCVVGCKTICWVCNYEGCCSRTNFTSRGNPHSAEAFSSCTHLTGT